MTKKIAHPSDAVVRSAEVVRARRAAATIRPNPPDDEDDVTRATAAAATAAARATARLTPLEMYLKLIGNSVGGAEVRAKRTDGRREQARRDTRGDLETFRRRVLPKLSKDYAHGSASDRWEKIDQLCREARILRDKRTIQRWLRIFVAAGELPPLRVRGQS